MKETEETVNREVVGLFLEKIGWRLKHHGHNYWYIYDHKGNSTNIEIWENDNRLTWKFEADYTGQLHIKLSDTKIEYETGMVNIIAKTDNENVFLAFYNHGMDKLINP